MNAPTGGLKMWFVPIARPGHYSDGWLVVAAENAADAKRWAKAVLAADGVTSGAPVEREVGV